eukprot:jgi/Tetstr1/458338/TSEL_004303.t1
MSSQRLKPGSSAYMPAISQSIVRQTLQAMASRIMGKAAWASPRTRQLYSQSRMRRTTFGAKACGLLRPLHPGPRPYHLSSPMCRPPTRLEIEAFVLLARTELEAPRREGGGMHRHWACSHSGSRKRPQLRTARTLRQRAAAQTAANARPVGRAGGLYDRLRR